MPGIYGMAILTIAMTAVLGVTTLGQLTKSGRPYYWLILAALPFSLVVNRFVKVPFLASLAAWRDIPLKLGPDMPFWFIVFIWLNSPIFEEVIKLFLMVVPVSRILLRDASQAVWAGFALGMGFGLGEAAYLAYGIAHSPAYDQLPWHMFTGFATERLIVTFGHGFLTSIATLGLYYGKRKALGGYLTAVGLHALINLGPILLALKLIPSAVSSMASYLPILATFLIFQNNLRSAKKTSGVTTEEIIYFEG